jgi:hypothetical protein
LRLPPGLERLPGIPNGELVPLTPELIAEACRILCDRGFLTCTRGTPGGAGATYALGWEPLDDPDEYPQEVRERHTRNLLRWTGFGGSA